MAVVKMILDKHGGKIQVVSELNEGSTFKIYLPV
ncbi:ATP-binding protein [uncultured Blautia sp.]